MLTRMAPFAAKLHPLVQGTLADPVRAWTSTRDFPEPAPENFRTQFKRHQSGKKQETSPKQNPR
jgi:hypothetical protein